MTANSVAFHRVMGRVIHSHILDQNAALRSIYMRLFTISERTVLYFYISEQNVEVVMLIAIEAGVTNRDILCVLE